MTAPSVAAISSELIDELQRLEDEPVASLAEIARLSKERGEVCAWCETRPLCFCVACFPPRGWDEALNALCHKCIAGLRKDRREMMPCPTCHGLGQVPL